MRLALLTALTMLAFAANSLFNRAALHDPANDAGDFGTLRLVSGAVTLAALATASGHPLSWKGPRQVAGPLTLGLYIYGFSYAYVALDAGLGALLLFGMVQITMFGGALAAGEAIPSRRWAGAGLAFAGLAWAFWPGGGVAAPTGPGLAMLAAGVGWGLFSLIGRRSSTPLQSTAESFLWAGVAALVVTIFSAMQGNWPALSVPGAALAVLSGALTSGLGYALWYAILPRLGATRAAVAQLTVPVIAMGLGVAFLGETLGAGLLAATGLVLGGVALALSAR